MRERRCSRVLGRVSVPILNFLFLFLLILVMERGFTEWRDTFSFSVDSRRGAWLHGMEAYPSVRTQRGMGGYYVLKFKLV